jgi:hypothetical protein
VGARAASAAGKGWSRLGVQLKRYPSTTRISLYLPTALHLPFRRWQGLGLAAVSEAWNQAAVRATPGCGDGPR